MSEEENIPLDSSVSSESVFSDPEDKEVTSASKDAVENKGLADSTYTNNATDDISSAALKKALKEQADILNEFANYKKRVERDQHEGYLKGVRKVATLLLPSLDALFAANSQKPLENPLLALAKQLSDVFAALEITSFGTVGEEFNPAIHEAISSTVDENVRVATCASIVRLGYQHKDFLLRPATVLVSAPFA